MANFYLDKEYINGQKAYITGEEAKHISKVLRMQKGDKIVLCDGCGMFFDAVLSEFSEKSVEADVLSAYPAPTEASVQITIFQGIPKNPKLETIVQKATEIGAVRIVPMNTVRAVAKFEKENKLDRLRKIAREAAKQSKRGIIPEVTQAVSFKDAVKIAKNADVAIIPYEEERELGIKEVLIDKKISSLAVMIGPEGGFAPEEIEFAAENGIIPVTLGKRILRTETAGLAVCAAALCLLGEMK